MKVNIGMLVALVATTQLAAAAPVPAWNGKNAEAAYVPNPMTLKITRIGY